MLTKPLTRPSGVVPLSPKTEVRPFVGVTGSTPNEPGEPCVTADFWLGGRISGFGVRLTTGEARTLATQLIEFADRAEGKS